MAERQPSTVLIVEDDITVRKAVRLTCESEGYEVVEAGLGKEALQQLEAIAPSVVILDVRLPDISGFDVCRSIRETGYDMPVLMLSGQNEEIDVVLGLEIGANDYIRKPFRPRELLARIATQLRAPGTRAERTGGAEPLKFRDLIIDPQERRAIRPDGDVQLTHTEFDLLLHLASNAGKVLSRDNIFTSVWGVDRSNQSRVLPVHIGNLRRKIEDDPAHPRHILTVPGVGYRFAVSKPE
jgi:two-component system alkaline phosphatase synthesis response regulator PhoP